MIHSFLSSRMKNILMFFSKPILDTVYKPVRTKKKLKRRTPKIINPSSFLSNFSPSNSIPKLFYRQRMLKTKSLVNKITWFFPAKWSSEAYNVWWVLLALLFDGSRIDPSHIFRLCCLYCDGFYQSVTLHAHNNLRSNFWRAKRLVFFYTIRYYITVYKTVLY